MLNTRGWGHRRVSKALGLSESSIHRWAEKFAPRAKNQQEGGKPKFKKAAIIDNGEKRANSSASEALCLELPCGARVTGLTLAQVANLMRRQP